MAGNLGYKAVSEFMSKGMDSQNHLRMLRGWVEDQASGEAVESDMFALEKQMISPGELNVIKSFEIQDRFTLDHMADEFEIRVRTSVVSKERFMRKDQNQNFRLSFRSDKEWCLDPVESYAHESTRSTESIGMDDVLHARFMSACNRMSGDAMMGINVEYCKGKLTKQSNMKHLFTKLYLLLHDYNLGVSSRHPVKSKAEGLELKVSSGTSDARRMALIAERDIVVDASGFTKEELGVLLLGAKSYPSVWYAGDNIYTQCKMEADSIAVVSRSPVEAEGSMAWGSPTRLYEHIVSVACKLGCLNDLVSVFTSMRGRCQMMADLRMYSEDNVVISDMPRSYCMQRALGERDNWKNMIVTQGGYFSTTACLVYDLVYGMMFKMAVANVIEDTGGLGKIMCREKLASLDKGYNGILRDYGLNHQDPRINSVTQSWQSLSGQPIMWSFGFAIKDYTVHLADEMRENSDVMIPQLTNLIPYSPSANTAWGVTRNYDGRVSMFMGTPTERKDAEIKTAAFMWAIGIRPVRPRLGANYASYKDILLDDEERDFLTNTDGNMKIESVGMSIRGSVGPRVDETENSCVALFKDAFLHTNCNMVYDYVNSWGLNIITQETTKAENLAAETQMKNTYPILGERAPRVEKIGKMDDSLEIMRTVMPLNVHANPQHKVNKDGVSEVGQYKVGGMSRNSALPVADGLSAGDKVSLEIIDTTGEGNRGIHALVNDLRLRGFCSPRECEQMEGRLDDNGLGVDDESELAQMARGLGFGLDVIVEGEDGYNIRQYNGDMERRIPVVEVDGVFSNVNVMHNEKGMEVKSTKPVGSQGGDLNKFRKIFRRRQ